MWQLVSKVAAITLPLPSCHGAHIERTSLFFHLLESGSAILTFLTSRMCRSDMLGLMRLDCEGLAASTWTSWNTHSEGNQPHRKTSHLEITTLYLQAGQGKRLPVERQQLRPSQARLQINEVKE